MKGCIISGLLIYLFIYLELCGLTYIRKENYIVGE